MTAHLLQTAQWVGLVLALAVAACVFWLGCDKLIDRFLAWWKPAPPIDLNVRLMTRAEYEEFLDLMSAAQESQESKRLRLAVSNSSPRVH